MNWVEVIESLEHHYVVNGKSRAEVYQLRKGRNKGMWRGYVDSPLGPRQIATVIHKTLEGVKEQCEVEFIRGQLIGRDP
jgi:hypothetical protein